MSVVKKGKLPPNAKIFLIHASGDENVSKRPEVREKISKALKGRKNTWTRKGRLTPWMKGNNHPMKRPEVAEKVAASLRGRPHPWCTGEKNFNWNGGTSFEPYCPKFNKEFKERVRAFFGYICPICGTPQNGEKLHVHHVDYKKDTCCSDAIPLFIALCESCHGHTSHANKKNRIHWEQHFTELINTYYGGKCYLTKEEMAAYAAAPLQG